jgi:hypothetical protein
MRILDQVRLGQFDVRPEIQASWDHYANCGVLNFNEAIPVEITNVYQWMTEEWPELNTNADQRARVWGQLEGLRPSFDNAWFGWRMSEIVTPKAMNRSFKLDARAIWAFDGGEDGGWAMILFERYDGRVCANHSWVLDLYHCSENGLDILWPDDLSEEEIEKQVGFVSVVFSPVVLAQSLMHCKNVVIEGQPLSPKRAKSFQRKHKTRPASFKTVKIEPVKTVIKRAGGVRGIGAEKAMHIVRGHFAEYTEEKPLFGKVTGRFFRPKHVRGNANIGVKPPDYSVQAPKK